MSIKFNRQKGLVVNLLSIKSLIVAILVGCIGGLCTYWVSLNVAEQLKSENLLKIENIAQQVSTRFQDDIDKSLNDLKGLQAFYSVNEDKFSRTEFYQYMDVLDIEHRDYIQALSWIPFIKGEDKDEFENFMKLQIPNFRIFERDTQGNLIPSQGKPYYTPVAYVSSYANNKDAIGFNLSSNDVRRNSLEFARDSGKMTTTAKIKLIQKNKHSLGVLIIAPVYKKYSPIQTNEQRSQALTGYVTGVFRINTLINNAKKRADIEDLELSLLDLNRGKACLLYGDLDKEIFSSFDLTIPSRHWKLNISINPERLKSIESPSIIKWILFGGIIISLLLGLAVYGFLVAMARAKNIASLSDELQNQNKVLEQKVKERTKSLADKNNQLNVNVQELTTQRALLSKLMQEADAAKVTAQLHAVDLARSNKDLDDFAYVASHDLKAPLRGIDQLATWVVEDLEEGNLQDIPEHLKMMRSRIKRLETLLSDLLIYSQANHQKNSISEIDANVVVAELFNLVCPLSGFTLTVDNSLPTFATFKAPFEQVVRNLLSNAVKHHHKDLGNITITCQEQHEYYQFSIADDGPGIALDYQQDIFKMFKTLKPRDETEGSGMGLALIKKIVEHYSGRVSLESEEGVGSTFTFTWPKHTSES